MTNLQGASRDHHLGQRERLSEGDTMYCVYWIRKQEHSEIYAEGYVGITINLYERIRAHKKNRKKTILTSVISKYSFDKLVVDVIATGLSQHEALLLEKRLRPGINIGWNLQTGGALGVDSSWYEDENNTAKHREATSIATKIAIATKDSTEARSSRAKESWKKTRTRRVLAVTGENNPKARLTEAQVVAIKYELIPQGMTNPEIAALFAVKPYVISFIRTGKTWKHA